MVLYALRREEIQSTAAGSGGARLIGIESIPGISATELQTALEAIATLTQSKIGSVADEGTVLPYQNVINFAGGGVTAADDTGNGRTTITIPGLSDYPHIVDVTLGGT